MAQCSKKSRILRGGPAAKPFTSSREAGKTRTNTRALARTHTPSPPFGPLCTRSPPPCAPPAAARRTGRVRGSGSGSRAGLEAQIPGCRGGLGGSRSSAPRGAVFRQQLPPSPEELRPALQHGGGGGARRGPGLHRGDESCRAARARSRRDPAGAASPPSPRCARNLRTDFTRPAVEDRRRARKSLRREVRGRCRQGEGKRRKTWSKEANFPGVPNRFQEGTCRQPIAPRLRYKGIETGSAND